MGNALLHPEKARLEAFGRGELELGQIDEIQLHLADCWTCCRVLDEIPDDNLLALIRRAGSDSDLVAAVSGPASAETAFFSYEASDASSVPGGGEVAEAAARPPSVAELPKELAEHPRYRVLELIGQGGMGVVYKAEHRLMRRLVALKGIHRELTKDPLAVGRFQREVRAAASLAHGNIVAAYDAERAGDIHFLAMEYVEGTDLAEVVRQRGPLPLAEACDYVRQAAEGLHHAYDLGMVHRDIKPHNLMLATPSESSAGKSGQRGVIKILDFGLASLTEGPVDRGGVAAGRGDLTAVGAIMGTPDYISPEQATDARSADIRSDIYSLGATFYFLLAGRPPFDEGTVMDKLRSHAEFEAKRIDEVRVDVPVEVADVIGRMMSKDPAGRFQTPAELADALAPFVEKHGSDRLTGRRDEVEGASRDAGKPQSGWRAAVRPRVAALVMCLLLIATALGAVLYVATDRGTLIIDSPDENVEIVIRKAGREVEIVDTVTGSKVVRLPSGEYQVALRGDHNQYTLDRDVFILERGSETVVTLRRKAEDVAAPLPIPDDAIVNSIGMALVPIPAGEFLMGSQESEEDRSAQERQHLVRITKPFYIGMCEVTQQEYYRVLGSNPSEFSPSAKYKGRVIGKDTSRFPVENVSWEDAVEFCRRLSERPAERNAGMSYRLPTEAEWEYACRAGATTPFFFDSELRETHANTRGNRPYGHATSELDRTRAVGSYPANAFGLYDMHGNVQEWCADWYEGEYYVDSPVDDPPGPPSSSVYGGSRVLRGGSWDSRAADARSAYRYCSRPNRREPNLGFRIVCEPGEGREAAVAALAAIGAVREAGGKVKFDGNNALVNAWFSGSLHNDAHLEDLRGADKLETLYLPGTKVTDAGLGAHVKQLTSLRNLYLPDTAVTDAGLEHLRSLTILAVLYLDRTLVTDKGLEHLKSLTRLVTLSLSGTQVTDKGLKHVKSLTNLGHLELNDTEIGDAGLEHLRELTRLTELNLKNTRVTDDGVRKLQQALPDCKVVR